ADQGAVRGRARAVPAGGAVHGGRRRQKGAGEERVRAGPAAGGEERLDDRAAGGVEQRPAALAGRQRHPRPAAGRALPAVGGVPTGDVPLLTSGCRAGGATHPTVTAPVPFGTSSTQVLPGASS